MALIKAIETDFGVDATYWNIGSYQDDFRGQGATLWLFGYSSQEARHSGAQPLASRTITIAGEDYTSDRTRPDLYAFVSENVEEFVDATNDI